MFAAIFFCAVLLAGASGETVDSFEELPEEVQADSGLASWPGAADSGPQKKCNDDYKDANIQNIPFIVSLETKQGSCSGAILDNSWVLTAHTCASRAAPEEYKIRAATETKGKGGTEHTVDKIIKHEQFGVPLPTVLKHNIALVKVKEPFVFTEKLFPVQMNLEENKLEAGKMIAITGIRKDVTVLQTGNLPILDLLKCRNTFTDKPHKETDSLYFGSLCLGYDYSETKKCSCEVRPGDVLVSEGKLVGLVSFRPSCDDTHWHPAVFADVAHYREWIYGHMKE